MKEGVRSMEARNKFLLFGISVLFKLDIEESRPVSLNIHAIIH